MLILPAIDLKDNKCVRLFKGDFSTVHQVSQNILDVVDLFNRARAEYIHVVDLDGALDGKRKNQKSLELIIKNAKAKIELGGGIRTLGDMEQAFSIGVNRVVIGSAAVENPQIVEQAAKLFSGRIAVGIDALDGDVKTSGWTQKSGIDYIEFAKQMESLGAQCIIFTDIDRDGMLSGPPIDSLKKLKASVSCDIIASGGVSSIEDLQSIDNLGISGAIVGKALYTGDIDIAGAIELLRA